MRNLYESNYYHFHTDVLDDFGLLAGAWHRPENVDRLDKYATQMTYASEITSTGELADRT